MLAIRLCPRRSSRRIRQTDFQSLRVEGERRTGPKNVGRHVLAGMRRWYCHSSANAIGIQSLSSSVSSLMTVVSPLNYTCSGTSNNNFVSNHHPSSIHQKGLGAIRHFAIKRSKRTAVVAQQKKEQQDKQSKTLVNEHLITTIMQNANTISAADVQVRVTADPLAKVEEGQPKKAPQIMTLQDAIQKALVEQKDLVEISIQQAIPVLTISSWESLQYKAEKLTRERRRNSAGQAAASVIKEVTIKVGIADNDLTRKVDDIIVFLSKGHNCQIVVKAPKQYATRDPTAARSMADRVVDMIEDNGGELVREIVMNEEQTHAKFFIRPRKL